MEQASPTRTGLPCPVRGQPATKWRGVSPTTEGRREALSQTTVTGQAGQVRINLSEVAVGYLPVCLDFLRSRINLSRSSASTNRRGR